MRKSFFTCPVFQIKYSWGLLLHTELWPDNITKVGRREGCCAHPWCVLCAQGVFVSVRIYRATSLPVPQSILSWPQEISSSSQEHHVILLLLFPSAFQQRLFQNSPRFPAQLSFTGLNRNQTDLAWQKRSHSWSSAETVVQIPACTTSHSFTVLAVISVYKTVII